MQLRGAKIRRRRKSTDAVLFLDEPEIPSARPRFEQDVYVHVQVPLPSRQTHNTVEGALGGSRAQTLRSMTLTI